LNQVGIVENSTNKACLHAVRPLEIRLAELSMSEISSSKIGFTEDTPFQIDPLDNNVLQVHTSQIKSLQVLPKFLRDQSGSVRTQTMLW
jgi:hypothetical protein